MGFDAAAALVTVLVALAMAWGFFRQYLARPRTHALWWGLAFSATALSALLQVMAFSAGRWTSGEYRTYVVLAAMVPALMGAGSLYLLWKRWALPYVVVILAMSVVTLVGAVSQPVQASYLTNVLQATELVTKVMPSSLVILGFAVLGSLGGLALVGGALWSWWKTRWVYNLGIAGGGIVFSLADTLSAYGIPALFFLAEILGVLLIYWAVRRSQTEARPASLPPSAAT